MRIALAGNPNSGKTTMYNALTGSSEKVGNWAGVTVDKKEHPIKKAYAGSEQLIAVDLPGAYSMSPFTSEESITSSFVKKENPDVIINIVDADNLSRSLFFTTQLLELGVPTVVALNKSDLNEKKGTKIDEKALSEKLGCPVVNTVSTSSKGLKELIEAAVALAGKEQKAPYEQGDIDLTDKKTVEAADRRRFEFVNGIVKDVQTRKVLTKDKNVGDKIDAILINKWLGIPIFAVVMFLVFQISQTWLGAWIAEGVTVGSVEIPGLVTLIEMFGEWVSGLMENAHPLLSSVVVDGIIGGVGAVVGFLPLVMVMYFLIALLEDCGYMARVAVVLDPIFKKVGLSGKSVIPFVIGTGCAIPGVMACRTIRNERERRATAMLTPFMPCGAKLPVIALFAGVFFGKSRWVGVSMYFVGIIIILLCALLINKLTGHKARKSFFIIELPEYKVPSLKFSFKSMCQRGWSYIVKAGTIILVCNFVVHILLSFSLGFEFLDYDAIKEEHTPGITESYAEIFNGKVGVSGEDDIYADWALLDEEDETQKYKDIITEGETVRFIVAQNEDGEYEPLQYGRIEQDGDEWSFAEGECYDMYNHPELAEQWEILGGALREESSKSILATISKPFAYAFAPITGTDRWEFSAATITGFIAKENVVGTLQVCLGAANQINDDFELIGDDHGALKDAFGIPAAAALALLMFNLFTPPCFAALGAMNSEIKSKKWFWAGVGLQFAVGYSLSFLVFFFGTLFTSGSFGAIWMPILGWAVVLAVTAIFTVMVIRKNNQLKAEYTLKA